MLDRKSHARATLNYMKIIMLSVGSIGIFLLLIITVTSLVCLLTGNASRSYPTLTYSSSVVVADRTISLEQLASTFKPRLFLRAGDSSPPALTMWWEAIDTGDSIALVYHTVWQDERHPVPTLHWIYYLYRAIVYGIPVRDIEYIQININRFDGSVQRIRYEGSSSTSYEDWVSKHIFVTVDRVGTQYIATATSQNNPPTITTVQINGSQLRFGIVTWSHQFILLEDSSDKYTVPVTMPLEYLTEENYTKYKLARRSQGDFATKDSAVSRAAKSTMSVLILGLPYLFSQFTQDKPLE